MSARILFAAVLLSTLAAAPALAEPFEEGSVRGSLIVGSGGAFNHRYFVAGAGLGYYVLDGLEVGLQAEVWFGNDPTITQVSPQTRYVFFFVPVLKPYVGAFYNHWFVGGGFDDVDTGGGRAGVFYVTGGGSYFGAGVVHEVILSECSGDCSDTYPEVALSFSF